MSTGLCGEWPQVRAARAVTACYCVLPLANVCRVSHSYFLRLPIPRYLPSICTHQNSYMANETVKMGHKAECGDITKEVAVPEGCRIRENLVLTDEQDFERQQCWGAFQPGDFIQMHGGRRICGLSSCWKQLYISPRSVIQTGATVSVREFVLSTIPDPVRCEELHVSVSFHPNIPFLLFLTFVLGCP